MLLRGCLRRASSAAWRSSIYSRTTLVASSLQIHSSSCDLVSGSGKEGTSKKKKKQPDHVRRDFKKPNPNLNQDLLNLIGSAMPKKEEHLDPLKQRRTAKRKRLASNVPHIIYFQVVGNGCPGGARGLLLYTETQRYLFNCSEGVQRICAEYCSKRTLGELSHILVTGKYWHNLGGLLGMCLSIRTAGAPDVTIHGPKGTMDVYDATKGFIVLHNFDVFHHGVDDPTFEDAALAIKHVQLDPRPGSPPLLPPKPKFSEWNWNHSTGGEVAGGGERRKGIFNVDEVLNKPYDRSVTAYVITCKSKAGKLQIEKCIELGVPPGPLLGELKAGRNVILDDGTCVKSMDVMEEEALPLSYIVVEVPSEDYLPSLKERLDFEKLEELQHIQGIFHFTKGEVLRSEGYLEWANSFPSKVQHVILNETNVGLGSHDLVSFNHKLRRINPKVFGELKPEHLLAANPKSDLQPLIKGRCIQAAIAQKIHVRPSTGTVEQYAAASLDLKAVDEELDAFPEVSDARKAVDAAAAEPSVPAGEEQPDAETLAYPKLTFLGTGSSVPNKYRNVSGILVETRKDNYMLLDCGEGTVVQIHRLFGRDKAQHILRNLKAVYVSHLHADHHLGFISVVQHRYAAFKRDGGRNPPTRLYLIAPKRMAQYLFLYHCNFEPVLENVFRVKNELLLQFAGKEQQVTESSPQNIYPNVLETVCRGCGLEGLITCRAIHCPSSFCVLLKLEGGFKLAYSGDTRPNEEFGRLAKGVDLLIHEATMEHVMLADCKMKRHSTFTEAIDEGGKMGAKFTLLTHLSQRYSKLPLLDEIEGKPDVGVAWDYMTVDPTNLRLISLAFPALKAVFHEEIDDMEKRRETILMGCPDIAVMSQLENDTEEEAAARLEAKRKKV